MNEDPRDCTWCAGFQDGYNVGPDGIAPDGQPAGGYNEALFAEPDYRAGLSVGRSDRIDEQLMRTAGGDVQPWPQS